eukprot:COSAG02_NODE_756_length_17532_cov_5.673550_8_plen_954_part_00
MGGAIFNGNINGRATAWMMVGMLIFAVMWESFTSYLERRFEGNKAHSEILSAFSGTFTPLCSARCTPRTSRSVASTRACLVRAGKVYKELMILGFIAFNLIMGKELGIVTMNAETLHCFEFCDLLVSICVLVYVANCGISSSVMHIAQRDWDRIAHTSIITVIDDLNFYLDRLTGSRWRRFKHRFASDWRNDADFKVMELLFKSKFHLPHNFDYVHYIKLVLQDVVVTMANITTLHWGILTGMFAFWWVGMVLLLPILGLDATLENNNICMVTCPDEQHRRQLVAAAAAEPEPCYAKIPGDTCSMNITELQLAWDDLVSNTSVDSYWKTCDECLAAGENLGPDDISSDLTLRWLVLYCVLGWLLAATQAGIVYSLHERMRRILSMHDIHEPQNLPELLNNLYKNVVKHALAEGEAQASGKVIVDDPKSERTDVVLAKELHHQTLINLDDDEANSYESDTIMVFSRAGKTANDVLSVREYESLMFATQLVQLLIDFYFGFYFVHMVQRVPKAFGHERLFDGATKRQLVFHGIIMGSVWTVFSLLMVTTKKISLLYGVLHLSEDGVTNVLNHMDMVKSVRGRIKSTLEKVTLVRGDPDPEQAQRLLDRAVGGELKLLGRLNASKGRISKKEIEQLVAGQENLTLTKEAVESFMDRDAFQQISSLPTAQSQMRFRVANTATTLVFSNGAEPAADTVAVDDFAAFLVQFVTDMMFKAMENGATEAALNDVRQALRNVAVVTDGMIEHSEGIARAKLLFVLVDTDGGGSLTQGELYKMLRRFKVPITKQQFKPILRLIDPDQSKSLELDEWLSFMVSSDDDLEHIMSDAAKVNQMINARKGADISTVMGEGVGLFFGETAGKIVKGGVEVAEKVAQETAGVVGKGLDTVGLESVRKELLYDEEEEAARQRRSDALGASPGSSAFGSPTSGNRRKKGSEFVNPMSESLIPDDEDSGGED